MDGRVIGFARRGNAEFRDFSIFLSEGGEGERKELLSFLFFLIWTLYHVCNIYIYILLVRFNSYQFTNGIGIRMEN